MPSNGIQKLSAQDDLVFQRYPTPASINENKVDKKKRTRSQTWATSTRALIVGIFIIITAFPMLSWIGDRGPGDHGGARKAQTTESLVGSRAIQLSPPEPINFDAPNPALITLDGTTPVQRFAFQCTKDKVASVYIETFSGDLVAAASLLDPNGSPFAQGVQISSNPNITIAEAFIIPASGACELKLSRSGSTSGSARLRLLSGYAHLARRDTFDEAPNPLDMTWTDFADPNMDVRVVHDQRLRLQIINDNVLAYITPDDTNFDLTDLYIQADFTIDDTPTYFEYGFLIHSTPDASSFYTVTFSSDGDYSIYYYNGSWNVIQDWTVSPLIDSTNQNPHIGLWVQGNTFRLYFGDQIVGEATDTAHYAGHGTVGLAAATSVDQTGILTVYVDNVVITTPALGEPTTSLSP